MHARSREITILVWGRKFSGTYEVEGDELRVSSPHGSEREPLIAGDHEAAARRLLKEVVLKNGR